MKGSCNTVRLPVRGRNVGLIVGTSIVAAFGLVALALRRSVFALVEWTRN